MWQYWLNNNRFSFTAFLVENIWNAGWIFLWHVLCILSELFFKEEKRKGRKLIFFKVLLYIRPWASQDTFIVPTVTLWGNNSVPILKMKKLRLRAVRTLPKAGELAGTRSRAENYGSMKLMKWWVVESSGFGVWPVPILAQPFIMVWPGPSA